MASTPRISRGTRRTLAWHPPSGLLWVPGEETGWQHPQTTSCWQQALRGRLGGRIILLKSVSLSETPFLEADAVPRAERNARKWRYSQKTGLWDWTLWISDSQS